jgi:hypothetical protein
MSRSRANRVTSARSKHADRREPAKYVEFFLWEPMRSWRTGRKETLELVGQG